MLLFVAALAIQADPLAPLPVTVGSRPVAVKPGPPILFPALPAPLPSALPAPLVVPGDWRAEFAAIRKGDWAGAAAGSRRPSFIPRGDRQWCRSTNSRR
jgi:hypothetical protein